MLEASGSSHLPESCGWIGQNPSTNKSKWHHSISAVSLFYDQAPPATPGTTPSATPSSHTHNQPRHNQISPATPSPFTTRPPRHLPPHSAIKHHHQQSNNSPSKFCDQTPTPCTTPPCFMIRHHQWHTLDDTLPLQQTQKIRDHPSLDLK